MTYPENLPEISINPDMASRKEIATMAADLMEFRHKNKAFIEWLTNLHNNDPDVDDYVEMFLGRILDKAKEML